MFSRNPKIVGPFPKWLVSQGAIVEHGTAIGSEVEFVPPASSGLAGYTVQFMLGVGSAFDVPVGSPQPVEIGGANPRYVRTNVGETPYAIWSPVTLSGRPLAPLRSIIASATTAASAGIWDAVPTSIPAGAITWVPVAGNAGYVTTGRRGIVTVTTAWVAPPAGFTALIVRGSTAPGDTPTPIITALDPFSLRFPDLLPGVTPDDWTPNGGAIAGSTPETSYTNDLWIYYRHDASGELRQVAHYSFVATPPTSVAIGSGAPALDVSSSGGSAAAAWANAIAVAQARISAGTAGRYVIGLPTYNYGDIAVVNLKAGASQEIAFRSIDLNIGAENVGGARFTHLRIDNCDRVHFYDIDVDRNGLSSVAYNELMLVIGSKSCGLHASRIRLCAEPGAGWLSMYVPHPVNGQYHMNPDLMKSKGNSGADGDKAGLKIATDQKGTSSAADDVFTEDFVLEDTLIFGPVQRAVLNSGLRTQTRRNSFEWLSGDNQQTSFGGGHIFEYNWLARDINPCLKDNASDWVHNDGHQKDAYWSGGTYVYDGCIDRGNVMMLRTIFAPSQQLQLPYQGIFTSDAQNANALIEDNIIVTDTPCGIGFGDGAPSATNVGRRNTLLPVVDWSRQSSLDTGTWIYQAVGMNVAASVDNVQVKASSPVPGTNSLYLQCGRNAFSIVETEYVQVRRNSSFYDARPIAGRPTHWAYTGGTKKGAWNRYEQVITQGFGVPLRGPALVSWRRQYNATDQITLP